MRMKKPLTFRQQANHLSRKYHLKIDDRDKAEQFLSIFNYYKFWGYCYRLLDSNNQKFREGVTFDYIYQLIQFDNELKSICYSAIQNIEIQLRTQIANTYSLKHGSDTYINLENFDFINSKKKKVTINNEQLRRFSEFISKSYRNLFRNCKNKEYNIHHLKRYKGHFPIWLLVEQMDFGWLINFYKLMKLKDKKFISKKFYDCRQHNFLTRIDSIIELRNKCAHYNRIYGAKFAKNPHLFSNEKNTKIPDLEKTFYSRLLVMKWLFQKNINKNVWNNLIQRLIQLMNKYSCIDFDVLGFPRKPKWYKNLIINEKK